MRWTLVGTVVTALGAQFVTGLPDRKMPSSSNEAAHHPWAVDIILAFVLQLPVHHVTVLTSHSAQTSCRRIAVALMASAKFVSTSCGTARSPTDAGKSHEQLVVLLDPLDPSTELANAARVGKTGVRVLLLYTGTEEVPTVDVPNLHWYQITIPDQSEASAGSVEVVQKIGNTHQNKAYIIDDVPPETNSTPENSIKNHSTAPTDATTIYEAWSFIDDPGGRPLVEVGGHWSPSSGLFLRPKPYQGPSNFQGRILRVTLKPSLPYVMVNNTGSGEPHYSGYLISILDLLSRSLNFTARILKAPAGNPLRRFPNGTWGGMFGQLINNEAEIALISLMMLQERKQAVHYLGAVEYSYFGFVIRDPTLGLSDDVVNWTAYTEPFSQELWLATAVLLVVSATMWRIMVAAERFSRGTAGERRGDTFVPPKIPEVSISRPPAERARPQSGATFFLPSRKPIKDPVFIAAEAKFMWNKASRNRRVGPAGGSTLERRQRKRSRSKMVTTDQPQTVRRTMLNNSQEKAPIQELPSSKVLKTCDACGSTRMEPENIHESETAPETYQESTLEEQEMIQSRQRKCLSTLLPALNKPTKNMELTPSPSPQPDEAPKSASQHKEAFPERSRGAAHTAEPGWAVFSVLVQQGISTVPVPASQRLLLGTLWVFGVVLAASYTSNIVALLASTQYALPFTSLAELASLTDWRVLVQPDTAELPTLLSFDELKQAPGGFTPLIVASYEEALQRVLTEDKRALFAPHSNVHHLMRRDCNLRWAPVRLLSVYGHLSVQKGLPYSGALSAHMTYLSEAGLLGQLWRKAQPGGGDNGHCESSGSGFQSMSLRQTFPAFAVLGTGMTMAGLVVLVEIGGRRAALARKYRVAPAD